ncbi:MAG: type II toxin-antitoxin system VapC family toxin [Hydrogenophaga sp.]
MSATLNVVDSCGWLEYFANGPNADFFAPAIEAEKKLVVPHVVVFEVTRRLAHQRGEQAALQAMRFLEKGRLMGLDAEGLCSAALAAQQHRLAMADALIWQTAISCGAQLYTQDADFLGLPQVIYRARPV